MYLTFFILSFIIGHLSNGGAEHSLLSQQYEIKTEPWGWSLMEGDVRRWSCCSDNKTAFPSVNVVEIKGDLVLINQWQCPGNVFTAGTLLAEDYNSDGQIDLGYSNYADTSYIYKATGNNLFLRAHTVLNPVGSWYTYFLGGGDGDGDGLFEMVFGSGTSGVPREMLIVESRAAGLYPDTLVLALPEINTGVNLLSVHDLDGDGQNEYLGSSQGSHDYLFSVWESNGDNSFIQVFTLNYGPYDVCGQFDVCDFDGDGNQEVVIVTEGNNQSSIHVIECTGDNQYQEIWSDYSIPTHNVYWVTRGPDLDRDGNKDFVIAGGDGFPTAVWSFIMYESAGNDSFETAWSHQRVSGIVDGGVVTEDLDGDGYNELMCQVPNYTEIFCYAGDDSLELFWESGTTVIGQSAHRLLGTDLDNDGKGEAIWWTTNEPGNLVIFELLSTGVEEEPVSYRRNFKIQSSPNPFRENVMIRFCLQEASPVSLTVFDLTGREVIRPIECQNYGPGNHEVIVDGSELPQGQSICRLVCKNTSENFMIVLSK